MAVNDECRPTDGLPPGSTYNRMTPSGNDSHVGEANSLQVPSQPCGTLPDRVGPLGLRTHTGDAKELLQLRDEPSSVGMSVAECARRFQVSPHRFDSNRYRANLMGISDHTSHHYIQLHRQLRPRATFQGDRELANHHGDAASGPRIGSCDQGGFA